MAGTYLPDANIQYFDGDGAPLASGKLYFYAAGTSTPLDTYSDVNLTTPNANPITLNAAGKSPTPVFLAVASYKQDVKNAALVSQSGWPKDNIASVALSTVDIGQEAFSFFGDPNVPTILTSYPSGTTFSVCHAGTSWWVINSANLVGTYVLQAMLMASGGTVSLALVNLTDGAPDTPMVTLTSVSATGERQVSSTITFAAAGANKTYALKIKVSAGSGWAWAAQIIRTA